MLQESGNFSFFHFCFNQFILYILLELKKKTLQFFVKYDNSMDALLLCHDSKVYFLKSCESTSHRIQ